MPAHNLPFSLGTLKKKCPISPEAGFWDLQTCSTGGGVLFIRIQPKSSILGEPSYIGIENTETRDFGLPNAYWLPVAEVLGKPGYSLSEDMGLFIWKNEGEVWHLNNDMSIRICGPACIF